MSNHPLQFFKDLIENPVSILRIEKEFYEEGEEFSILVEGNKEEGYVTMIDPLGDGDVPLKAYFKDHIKRLCLNAKHEFQEKLDAFVFNESDIKSSSDYLQKSMLEVEYLISVKEGKEWLNKYSIIIDTVIAIKDHLHSKYGLPGNSKALSNKKVNRIQWLGKTNVLTTLFYDLLNGQDKGEPYIHSSKKEVMQFLIDNFLDKNGDELSESTVQSYFDKPNKKAKIGDRIELPNKRIIK